MQKQFHRHFLSGMVILLPMRKKYVPLKQEMPLWMVNSVFSISLKLPGLILSNVSKDQSNFFLYSLNKETGVLCRETSLIDADELFGYNRALTGIGIRNETDGGLPIWPFFSFPAKKLMIQFNTAVEIEYLKEK